MVDAVEVVVAEVALEIALEPGEADVQVAGEGGSPALIEDRLVRGPEGAIRLRPAGADERVPRPEAGDAVPEARGPKLAAVIREHALELPTGGAELGGHAAGELRGLLAARVAAGDT